MAWQCAATARRPEPVRDITLITSGFANSGANAKASVATCAGCGYLHQFVLGSLESRPYDA